MLLDSEPIDYNTTYLALFWPLQIAGSVGTDTVGTILNAQNSSNPSLLRPFAQAAASTTIIIGLLGNITGTSNLPIMFIGSSFGELASINVRSDLSLALNVPGTGQTATSAPIPTLATGYHYFQWVYTPSFTGTGSVSFYVDGTLVMSASGINTAFNNGSIQPTTHGYSCLNFRDLYVLDDTGAPPCNGILGQVKVTPYFPNGDVQAQWTNTFGGANYLQVNSPVPPGLTAFLESDTVGNEDQYNMQDLDASAIEVYGVTWRGIMQHDIGGARDVAPVYLTGAGGTRVQGASISIGSGTFALYQEVNQVSVFTAAQWTVTEVNGMLLGENLAS